MEFTVLMSLYWKEKPEYLDASLESILDNQNLKPKEVVIVEDGPISKELEDILKKFKNKYKIIKTIKLEKNVGLGKALKIGVENCSYDIIARMDTDDISLSTRFEKQINFLRQNKNIKIIGTNAVEFEKTSQNKMLLRKYPEKSEDIKKFMKKRCPFLHPTVMFYKDIVLEVGSYRDLLYFEDYDLFLRILKKYEGYNIQENLIYFRGTEETYKRRGGLKYISYEIRALKLFYKEELHDFKSFITNIFFRIGMRLLTNSFRKKIYQNLLRGKMKC